MAQDVTGPTSWPRSSSLMWQADADSVGMGEHAQPRVEEGEDDKEYAVIIKNLNFSYGDRKVLSGIDTRVRKGSRCLLIGANGAGKSTLLRILGGRHLTKPDEAISVLGMNAFRDTKLNLVRAYLDCDWGMKTVAFAGWGVPLQADIPVHGMMSKLQNAYPERRDELQELLGVDPNWRMHRVSDGQRRRVQLFLGLVRPFDILLLDEVTVSLDVVVRQDLLRWLRRETETRNATVIYATHIFDGLDDWPTHLHYITHEGRTGWQGRVKDLEYYRELRARGDPGPLLQIAERWLRGEMQEQKAKRFVEEEQGQAAHDLFNALTNPTTSGGGFVAGRMYDYTTGQG